MFRLVIRYDFSLTALLLSLSVAENLVHRGRFCVDTGSDVVVDVLPLYEFELRKFQVRFQHTLVSEICVSAEGRLFDGVCCGLVDVLGSPESHRAAGGNPGADG